MEDFFKDSNFLKKKESFEICIENQKEQEDFSSLALLENHSPGINKRKSKKSDFLIQKIEVNLSISSKKKKKRESFQMFHSMMPAILSSNKGTSLNEKDLHGIQSLKKENAKRSYVRHPSLTYSKRDKYISNFDGKSIILSKVIRPSESNDNSLIYIENNFGKLDHDLYIQSPGLKPRSKNLKESSNGKSVFAARCKKSLRKENENQEFLLTIKKTSFENGEENFGMSRKLTSSEEEAEDQNTNLEPTANIFDVVFEEMEQRIYKFLEQENVEFVMVDQLEKYNDQLRYKKLIKESKNKPMSPLMQRRQNLRGMTSPLVRNLNLKSCMSSDNLENILNIKLDIN